MNLFKAFLHRWLYVVSMNWIYCVIQSTVICLLKAGQTVKTLRRKNKCSNRRKNKISFRSETIFVWINTRIKFTSKISSNGVENLFYSVHVFCTSKSYNFTVMFFSLIILNALTIAQTMFILIVFFKKKKTNSDFKTKSHELYDFGQITYLKCCFKKIDCSTWLLKIELI